MRHLIFARHGNNFADGDKLRWIGCNSDLPLVAAGLRQAEAAAEALARRGDRPDRIYCASLERTRHFAAIIAEQLRCAAPIIDARLDELDYGAWEGLSNDEIIATGPEAKAQLDGWAERDLWPEAAGWGSRKADIIRGLTDFIAERLGIATGTVLIVSSNGILRFLPRLLLTEPSPRSSFKMRTGHLGRILQAEGAARLLGWDLPPDAW